MFRPKTINTHFPLQEELEAQLLLDQQQQVISTPVSTTEIALSNQTVNRGALLWAARLVSLC